MPWIRTREGYAEGWGEWRYSFLLRQPTEEDLREVRQDVDQSNSWNHGYRGCQVEVVEREGDVPVEVVLEEAKSALSLYRDLEEKLKVLETAIRTRAGGG